MNCASGIESRSAPRIKSSPFCATIRALIAKSCTCPPALWARPYAFCSRLTAPLPGQIVSRVRVGELPIGRRVPKIGIDAVQDPRQAVAEPDEGVVQAEPALRCAQLSRVRRAD